MKKNVLIGLPLLVAILGVGFYVYVRSHSVNDAKDRLRWSQEIDKENAQQGFVKDTNGALIYVGGTNSQNSSN